MTLSHNLLAKRSRRRRFPPLRPAPFSTLLGFLSHVSGSALTKRGMDGQFDERVDPRGLAGGIRKPVGGNNSFRGRRRRKIPMCQTDVCKSSAAAALKSDVSGDVGTREILLNYKARTAIIAGSTESEVDWLNIFAVANLQPQSPETRRAPECVVELGHMHQSQSFDFCLMQEVSGPLSSLQKAEAPRRGGRCQKRARVDPTALPECTATRPADRPRVPNFSPIKDRNHSVLHH